MRHATATYAGATGLLLLLGALAAPSGAAAQARDGGWTAWLGCWEPAEATEAGAMLCIRPHEDAGAVEVLTVEDSEIARSETLRAGARTPVEGEGCSGWERADFSEDLRRVYLRSEMTCQGNTERTTTGLYAFVSPREWLDLKAIEVEGRTSTWVLRYRPAAAERVEEAGLGGIAEELGMAVSSARIAASRALDTDQIIEASERLDPELVEAWIAQKGDRLDVNADRLVRLADAGVPESVIDVAVAVSYPSEFQVGDGVERAEEVRPEYGDYDRWAYGRPYYDPLYMDPFYYGAGSLFYSPYSGFGFGRGFGFFGGFHRPSIVVIDRKGDSGGRAVNGRGYSQGRRSSSGGAASAIGGAIRRVIGGSPSGSSASAGSSSSGSKGTKTGRKAKRRGGGGGGDDGGGGLYFF